MEEVFAPSKFDTSKQATEETKRLGLSIAYKIQQRLIALEPEHDNFFYLYMYQAMGNGDLIFRCNNYRYHNELLY